MDQPDLPASAALPSDSTSSLPESTGRAILGPDHITPATPEHGLSLDEPQPTGTLEAPLDVAAPAPEQSALPSRRRWRYLSLGTALIIGLCLTIAAQHRTPPANSLHSVDQQYGSVSLKLKDLPAPTSADLLGTVTINGQLNIQNSLVLGPSAQPASPMPGQLYYDQTSNQLSYFNGKSFATVLTGDTAVTPPTASLAAGSGLSLANGLLTNAGVLSLQGKTGDVSLTAGAGLQIRGTSFSNSGVLSLGGLHGDVILGNGLSVSGGKLTNSGVLGLSAGGSLSVTDDGNGNYTISGPFGVGTGNVNSSGGTSGHLAVFNGAQAITDSLLSEAGSTVSVAGSLVVSSSISATSYSGDGASITNVNASKLGGQSSNYYTNASNLSSGTVSDSRLSINVALLNGNDNFTGSLQHNGNALCDTSGNCVGVSGGGLGGGGTAGKLALFTGSGFSLGNSLLSQDAGATTVSVNGDLDVSGAVSASSLSGDGSGVTNVDATQLNGQTGSYYQDASNLTIGTLSDSRLSGNVALLSGSDNFTGSLQHNGHDVCDASGNCVGSGAGGAIGGSGSSRTIALFTGSGYTIGNSLLSQDAGATTVSVNGDLQVTGSVSASSLSGDGSGVTNVNAAELEGNAGSYYQNASNLNAGTLDDARLSTNVARLGAAANFTAALQHNGHDVCDSSGNCAGSGLGGSGTLNNFALFTGTQAVGDSILAQAADGSAVSVNGDLQVTGSVSASSFSGDGSGVTNVDATKLDGQAGSYYQNAGNLNAGTLSDSRLSSNAALYNNATSNFTGNLQQNGSDVCTTAGNCSGTSSGGLGGGGTAGKLALFTGSGFVVGDSLLSQDAGATTVTVTGSLNVIGANLQHNGHDVCDTTGNCAGSGGGVTTTGGSANQIALFTGAQTLGASMLTQDAGATTLTVAGDVSVSGGLSAASLSGDGSGVTDVDAAELDGQAGSYYQNAGNLNAGTVGSGRLSGTYSGVSGVGTLTTGSIGSGFGAIATNSDIATTTLLQGATVNATTGFSVNGTVGSSLSCSGGQLLQDATITGGIVTGGSCGTASGDGVGATTVGALDGGTANANGATISGTTLYLQSASASFAGLVNTGSQTFAGDKTFSGALTQSGGNFSLTGTGTSSLTAGGSLFLNASGSSKFLTTSGDLTLGTSAATGQVIIQATGGTSPAISIGDSSTTHISIGSVANIARTIDIGSANTSVAQTINLGSTGTVNIGSTGSASTTSTTNIGNSTSSGGTQAVNLGSSANAANALTLEAGNVGKLQIGNSSTAHTILIGAGGSATQTVTIGSTSSASSVTIQAGPSGTGISLQGALHTSAGFSDSSGAYLDGTGQFGGSSFSASVDYWVGGNRGTSLACSGGQFLQNQVVQGGIVTGGACATAGGGVSTIGMLDGGTANANGATISGTTLYLQSASASFAGLVNTGSQTFAGDKTFSDNTTVNGTFNVETGASKPVFNLGNMVKSSCDSFADCTLQLTSRFDGSVEAPSIELESDTGMSAINIDAAAYMNIVASSGVNISANSASFGSAALFVNRSVANASKPVAVLQEGATPGAGADALQIQNSAGTVLSGFNNIGQLYVKSGSFTSTLTQASLSQNQTITLPASSASTDTVCLLTLANCSGGLSTIGTLNGGTASANGASISGSTLYLQSASASNPGLVDTGTQTFAGDKTFNGNTSISGASANAFTIQNGSSVNLMSADTSAQRITIGSGSLSPTIVGTVYQYPSTPTFATKATYTFAGHLQDAKAGDLNGDGKPDLVTPNWYTTYLFVKMNNGNGTFGSTTNYSMSGYAPQSVSLADFNGDGKNDLVVADNSASKVSVFMNNGDGTFAAKVDYATGSLPDRVTTGDFNGDGKPDIAVAYNGSQMSVLLNNGNGTFAARTDYGSAGTTTDITTADVNGDGHLDIITTNRSSNSVSVFINAGNGTFAAHTDYPVGSTPYSVATADINGDGKPDLVTGNSGASTVSVLLNNGGGTFAAHTDYPIPQPAGMGGDTTLADINGDGKPDIISVGSSKASVLLNKGDSTFGAATSFTTSGSSMSVSATDVNGDGKLDLIIADYSGVVDILMNTVAGPVPVGTTQSEPAKLQVLTDAGQGGILVQGAVGQTGNLLQLQDVAGDLFAQVTASGAALFKNGTDTTNAFQVQNAAGTNILNVDTATGGVQVSGALTANGSGFDGDGNLGVGTTTPGANLDVQSGATTGTAVNITANDLTTGSALSVNSTAATSTSSLISGSQTGSLSSQAASSNLLNLSRNYTATSGSNGITLDATSSKTVASGGTLSWTHTVGTGANRVLIVNVNAVSNQTVSVTYAGLAMTQLGSVNGPLNFGDFLRTFILVNPPSGTATVAVSVNTGSGGATGSASSWSNVNQATPTSAYVSGNGDTATTSLTVGSASGEVVIDAIGSNYWGFGSSASSAGASQTILSKLQGAQTNMGNIASSYQAGAASTTMTWSEDGSAYNWAGGAFALKPATASGSSVSGAVANFSSNCTETTGSCSDTSNILSLNQQFAGATGAVLALQNAGSGDMIDFLNSSGTILTSVSSTGTALFKNSSDSTTAFQIQNASGTALFTVDTSGSQVVIGTTSNGIILNATTGLSATGSARKSKALTYDPEFAGAVLDAQNDASCASTTNGTMTAGLDGARSFYQWTSSQTGTQCFDVALRVTTPSDFSAWSSSKWGSNIRLNGYSTDTTNSGLSYQILNSDGSVQTAWSSLSLGSNNSWQTFNLGADLSSITTPDTTFVIQFRMSAANGAVVRLGQVQLNYLAGY